MEKYNIWKRWWLGLAYFNPVLPLNRNHTFHLLHKSQKWLLCICNTDRNDKVDVRLR